MTRTFRHSTRIRRAAAMTMGAGVLLVVAGVSVAPASAAPTDHQITICHATSPGEFSTPNPAKWQITSPNGHGSLHFDVDIIPPYDAGTHGGQSWDAYPGANWDTEYGDTGRTGEDIWEAGCNVEPAPPGSVTLDKVTAGDGQPAGTTEFAFTVVCDTESEDAVVEGAPSITPEDPAAIVASGLASGDTCTITETGTAGAASTSHSVNGGSAAAGTSVEVTIVEGAQAVLFTNTYACPAGEVPDGEGGCEAATTTTTAVVTTQATVAGVVIVATPAAPAPAAAAPLPATGSTTLPLAELGLGLVLLGLGGLVYVRDDVLTS